MKQFKTSQQLNTFQFYDYKGKAKKENQDLYMDYLRVNEEMLKIRLKEKNSTQMREMTINGPYDNGFQLLVEQ